MQRPKWFVVGDLVTAADAAKIYGLHVKALTEAIDAGLVRAERIPVGKRCIRYIDPRELEEHLASRPRCAYVSKAGVVCEQPVTLKPGSFACSGPHARAIETRGKSWRTAEAIEKSNAAKRGKERPDVRERVLAMQADKEQRYAWGVALVEGRHLGPDAKRRWKGRLGGLEAARTRGAGRRRTELPAEVVAEVERLTRQGFGRGWIAMKLGISERQVRNARSL